MKRIQRFLPPIFIAATLLWVYGSTLAPGITWAHDGADGGDLITATATGGVPHPTGYPLYLLLAGFFQRLPIGPLAFRTNLLSALAMTGASLLVYQLVHRQFSPPSTRTGTFAGLASAFAFALAPLVWSQAVITEVYALHLFFIALVLYLSCELPSPALDRLTGLALGLALAHHITSIFLLPLVFLGRRDAASFWRRLAFLALGLLTYLIIPIRAAHNAPVNWADASTWDGFLWLVSGQLYQDNLFILPDLWLRIRTSASVLLSQFSPLGLVLSLPGLAFLLPSARLRWSLLWLAGVFSVFAVAYSTRDSQVHLLPVVLCLAIGLGATLGRLIDAWPKWRYITMAIFATWLILWSATTWPQVDLSNETQAEQFGASTLAQLPPDAIVFVKTDEAVFTLWYFHFALGQRPDVAVVAEDLLHHEWYLESLRAAYPALVVPGPLPFVESVRQANPERAACYVSSPQARVECLEISP